MEYGYVRVSSKSQNPDRQIRELQKHGICPNNIFVDKFTGKTCRRPGFSKLIRKIKPGDVIYVVSFDRLGRNYIETTEVWSYITKKETDIVVLDLPILDTRDKASGDMGRFISDLVVQILAYLAEAERKKNREAQRMGIEAKKARGEWEEYGRPKKVSKDIFAEYYKDVEKNKLTEEEVRKILDISETTYWRYKKELEVG